MNGSNNFVTTANLNEKHTVCFSLIKIPKQDSTEVDESSKYETSGKVDENS